MTTIKDIAARANVSIKTVSRVINGESGVSEATRQHVQRVVREMDYVPNLSAQRLKRGKSELIALVLPRVESPYAIKLFASVLAEARQHQYFVLVLEYDPGQDGAHKTIGRIIKNQRIDGLVIAPPGGDNACLIAFLQNSHIPYVVITPNYPDAHLLSVETTDRQGALEAMRYLISLGHQRIACVTCLPSERFSQERLAGYMVAMGEVYLPVHGELICEGDNSVESGYEAAMALLQMPEPPTAIFAGNDEMAVGVILAASQLGIRIPDELSVMGFDDAPISRQVYPRLTTVYQPIAEFARSSIDMLVSHIESRSTQRQHIQIPTHLVIRHSCAVREPSGSAVRPRQE
jgi:LacI family transcriptional regulator